MIFMYNCFFNILESTLLFKMLLAKLIRRNYLLGYVVIYPKHINHKYNAPLHRCNKHEIHIHIDHKKYNVSYVLILPVYIRWNKLILLNFKHHIWSIIAWSNSIFSWKVPLSICYFLFGVFLLLSVLAVTMAFHECCFLIGQLSEV